jgi:hypothetical protein
MTLTPFPRSQGTGCDVQASGGIELYFYDELEAGERDEIVRHLKGCRDCRQALEEMTVIRKALDARPAVSAPPSGDWSAFMARLNEAVAREGSVQRGANAAVFPAATPARAPGRQSAVALLMMAALLTLVTISVVFVARSRGAVTGSRVAVDARDAGRADTGDVPAESTSLSAVSQQHLERSKLVLLGLTSKDVQEASGADWTYERELAGRLLTDTRLYRMAAEDRGLDALAGVMRDLELVLLQTSMTEGADPAALSQIQRAIRKRDLLQKMDVVRTSAGI